MKKRIPLLAMLLSLLMPGLGQLYNGNLRRALAFYGVYILTTITVAATALSTLPQSLAGFVFLFAMGSLLSVWLWVAAAHAYVDARQTGLVALRPFNRWYVYGALVLLQAAVFATYWSLDLRARASVVAYEFPSVSMFPGLRVGDYLVAARGVFDKRMPVRGEMVVYRHPKANGVIYIKRVIGLPGDRVGMRNGRLQLNGAVVERQRIDSDPVIAAWKGQAGTVTYIERLPDGASYQIVELRDNGPFDNTPVYEVPADRVFVLGDNRDRSRDSRFMESHGLVPLDLVIEKPLFVFWSRDWGRIGTPVR